MDTPILALLAAAFSLGLLSSAHCVGMCGGIMGALTLALPTSARGRRLGLLLSYNLGRIGSYVVMGVLFGAFAGALLAAGAGFLLRLLAGMLLIAMGLYLADWWRGLIWLERGGRYLWAYLQPLGKGLLPVRSAPRALLLGAIWGWLPCGLVYTALAYAMAQASALVAGAVMLAFGVGTLPAVLATGLAAQRFGAFLRQRGVRTALALLIILFGFWTLLGSGHLVGHGHSSTGAHPHSTYPSGSDLNHRH